ncbi:unnamed protein product, partial [Meganyctiphanes norvegica]
EYFDYNSDISNMSSNTTGYALPDIIMDTVPPPSPLRRAHSHNFVFPVKSQTNSFHEEHVISLVVAPRPCDLPEIKIDKQFYRSNQKDTDANKLMRSVGTDLRKIADKFHHDHSKICRKDSISSEDTLNVAIPVVVTRCLQAGIMTLLCWRLLNKLR